MLMSMGSKNVYVSETDLPILERAAELAGGMSTAVVAGVRLYVAQQERERKLVEMSSIEVTVQDGPVVATKRFVGRQVLRYELGDGMRTQTFRVYLTAKGQYAVHSRNDPDWSKLSTPDDDIWLPAIVVEEQLRGRLSVLSSLNSARISDRSKIPRAYELLLETVRELQRFQHLPYTAEMEALFQSWPTAVKRLGTRDCRIAAAIVHGFTAVTGNTRHCAAIPGVSVEDWSA